MFNSDYNYKLKNTEQLSVGFTGSRVGMNHIQTLKFQGILRRLRELNCTLYFSHGDCIGCDAQAHDMVKEIFGNFSKISIFPGPSSNLRAYCSTNFFIHPSESYIKRNKKIVDNTNFLIAIPNTNEEVIRSGTWSTIRYAKKKNKKIIILYPNGNQININFLSDYLNNKDGLQNDEIALSL